MPFRLSSQNVLNYLIDNQIINWEFPSVLEAHLASGKNFNLLVRLEGGQDFLVKQERYNEKEKTVGEFWYEWYLHQLLGAFPELAGIRPWIVEPLHFDSQHSILVVEYLQHFLDLSDFYEESADRPEAEQFPPAIATALGTALAHIHRSTYRHPAYEPYLTQLNGGKPLSRMPSVLRCLERVSVRTFGKVDRESLQFFRLFQRYDSLRSAIAQLKASWNACCLIHRDLRLSNILLHQDWRTMDPASSPEPMLRLIDWEKMGWGDPAFDLGTVIAHYLEIWLDSLVVHKGLDLSMSLQLAQVPISQLQPSLMALVQAYVNQFPEIVTDRSNFLWQALQFAGIVLIGGIAIKLDYHRPFDNCDICKLQVAKTLLCQPEKSELSVFGGSISLVPSDVALV
jgi:hypothetical protein